MREHKYRAWYPAYNKMYYKLMVGELAPDAGTVPVLLNREGERVNLWADNSEGTIMQSTGVTDCAGVEIYDGDIVRITHTSLLIPAKTIGVVTYTCARYVVDTHAHTHGLNMFVDRRYRRYGKPHIEVIGNVWETPHLAPKK